jgi:ADP-ribose pyrophosphatase YjhB (NUDIX family)
MKYSGSLVKIEREKIFSLFLTKEKLKFTDIEKSLDIRSNMVSYHLMQMIKEKILKKKNEFYELTELGEKYLPIFSHVTGKEIGPVPVMLVAVIKTGKIKDELLLIKRKNRPYKDYWSMIGGKLKLNESFDDASVRLVKEKTGLDSKFISLNAILHEKVHGEEVKHSFILFFTKVEITENKTKYKTKNKSAENIAWFQTAKLKEEEIIPSDYWLLKHKLNKKLAVFVADMNDEEGRMKNFKVKNVNRR